MSLVRLWCQQTRWNRWREGEFDCLIRQESYCKWNSITFICSIAVLVSWNDLNYLIFLCMFSFYRFTSVRVTAKYHGIKLEYREHRHTVLDLLNQLNIKLRSWKRAYISQEAVRVLMQDWNVSENFNHKNSKSNKVTEFKTYLLLGIAWQLNITLFMLWSQWMFLGDCE